MPKPFEPHILLSRQFTLLCAGWKYHERSAAFIPYTVKTGGGSHLFSMFKIKQIYAAFFLINIIDPCTTQVVDEADKLLPR